MSNDLIDLIYAIGRAEGWGIRPSPQGGYEWDKYNSYTIAPFGLIYDAKKYPQLMNDANLAVEFMISKLTGKPTERVRNELGITRFSGTVVPNLVDAQGKINIDKIRELASRYAPVGADNDPASLNKNWSGNVMDFIARSPFGSSLPTLPGLPNLSEKPIHTDTPLIDENKSSEPQRLEDRIIDFLKNAGWVVGVFVAALVLVIVGAFALYKGD